MMMEKSDLICNQEKELDVIVRIFETFTCQKEKNGWMRII